MRVQKAIALQQLASRTNLSNSFVPKIEDGKVSSPLSTLFTIAKGTDSKITYFFNEQDKNLPINLVRKNERGQFHRINARFG